MSNKTKTMTWDQIQSFVSELDLADQIQFAKLKGVEVPQSVLDEQAAKNALQSIQVEYGSKRDPDKVYLTFADGVPVGGSRKDGSPRMSRAPYLDIRSLDGEIARLTAARDTLRQAGMPTGPCEPSEIPGPEHASKAGFRVKNNRVTNG